SAGAVAHRDLHSFPTRRSSDLRGTPKDNNGAEGSCQTSGFDWCFESGDCRRARYNGRDSGQHTSAAQEGVANETGVGTRCVKARSEEHTSELQSLAYLVCRLLL